MPPPQTPFWDPDSLLQITRNGSSTMFCVGRARTRFNARCRWEIDPSRYTQICTLLDSIALMPPDSELSADLSKVADLGLCEHHYGQTREIVRGWKVILRGPADEYRIRKELERQVALAQERFQKLRARQKKCVVLLQEQIGSTTTSSSGDDLYQLLRAYVAEQSDRNMIDSTELDQLGLRLDQMVKDSEGLKASNREFQARLAEAHYKLDKALLENGKIPALDKELAASLVENGRLKETISGLKHDAEQVQDQLREERGRNVKLSAEKEVLADKLNEAERQLEEARRQESGSKVAYEELSSQNSDAQVQIEELRTQLCDAENQIADLTTQLEQLDAQNGRLGTTNDGLRNEMDELRLEMERLRGENRSLMGQLESALEPPKSNPGPEMEDRRIQKVWKRTFKMLIGRRTRHPESKVASEA
ncbi:hypothetical protein AJ80_07969 [Polytolypa hystricis UAMH7299]|uniref:Uncharacterized protein n=1 Tax=Polytolypa hystricis (strain UAMH7299) TaxID=1447883 RepID=A0A2B7XF99_POLH7|nr:hypothetical protein AJ80_07969 [Polytolypa hystricis UAMH7299]